MFVAPIYNRSEIFSFYDLTESEQNRVLSMYGTSEDIDFIYEGQYVKHEKNNTTDVLPLFMFVKSNTPIWSGVYGTSYFSAYFIKISKHGDGCVIAERYF